MPRPTVEELRQRKFNLQQALRERSIEGFRAAVEGVHQADIEALRIMVAMRYSGRTQKQWLDAIDEETKRRRAL